MIPRLHHTVMANMHRKTWNQTVGGLICLIVMFEVPYGRCTRSCQHWSS